MNESGEPLRGHRSNGYTLDEESFKVYNTFTSADSSKKYWGYTREEFMKLCKNAAGRVDNNLYVMEDIKLWADPTKSGDSPEK